MFAIIMCLSTSNYELKNDCQYNIVNGSKVTYFYKTMGVIHARNRQGFPCKMVEVWMSGGHMLSFLFE